MSTTSINAQQIELLMIMEDTKFFRDMFHQIIPQKSASVLVFGYFPYISLYVLESYKYLQKIKPSFTEYVHNEYETIVRSSRTMVKLFNEHLRDINEITKSIEWLIKYHKDWFMRNHKGIFTWLKKLLQCDLGLYYYDNELISTTHVGFFNVGFERDNIEKYGDDFQTIMSNIAHKLGVDTGNYTSILCNNFNINASEINGEYFNYTLYDDRLRYIDKKAEKYYPDIFNEPSSIALNFGLLLYEATVKFINHIFQKISIDTPLTLFKHKFISLYHLSASLKRFQNYFYPQGILTKNSKECFKEILSDKELKSIVSKTDFRNILVHYDLAKFPTHKLDLDIKLYGLIEHFFNGMSFDELNSRIDAQLARIESILTNVATS